MDKNPTTFFTVYDIETLINLSTFCFKDYITGKKKEFVIHESRNDYFELIKFLTALRNNKYFLIGFNNVDFDGQIIHYMMVCYQLWKDLPAEAICKLIHAKAQELIQVPDDQKFTVTVPERLLTVMQIDVYRQKHYDGKAKRTSLKWLEFTMRRDNIEEMPVKHDEYVKTEDIPKVLSYNWEDVEATFDFFERIKFETELRMKLSEQFDLPLLNASEPRMAREILAKLLADDMHITIKELKGKKTFRKEIHLGKCILPFIKFKTDGFNELVTKLKTTTINALNTKACFTHSINYLPSSNRNLGIISTSGQSPLPKTNIKPIAIEYGVGGVHGAVDSGVYVSDDDFVIKTVDVVSFYPNMIITYDFAPAHLGQTFANRYKWFFTERKKYGKKDPINYIYKIILNSTYGLSNDINSFIYDTLTTMKTTINGQLLLSMLAETLSEIPCSQLIMMNTDGLEIRIPRSYEEQFSKLCSEWEKLTGLNLEGEEYSKMVIGDVNNYIAVCSEREAKSEEEWLKLQKDEPNYVYRRDGATLYYSPVKLKGRFELKLDYHKNPSALCVSKAVYSYFINGTPVEEEIAANDNIFDFCYGVKKKRDFELILHSVVHREHVMQRQQKVTRYYVSTDGGKLVKEYHDGRIVSVSASALVTPCNRLTSHAVPLNIERKHYIEEAYKEIENIEGKPTNQLTLF